MGKPIVTLINENCVAVISERCSVDNKKLQLGQFFDFKKNPVSFGGIFFIY
jgi:hypothetical protein